MVNIVLNLEGDVKAPVYATLGSVGCDFFAKEDFTIPPTTVGFNIDKGWFDLVEVKTESLQNNLKLNKSTIGNGLTAVRIISNHQEGKPYVELDEAHYISDFMRELMKELPNYINTEFNIGTNVMNSGVSMEIPDGSNIELEMRSKSGPAFEFEVLSFNGTIDEDYRNQIHIKMYNLGKEPYTFKKGEKVCQGIFKQIIQPNFITEPDKIFKSSVDVESVSNRESNPNILNIKRTGGICSTGK